MEMRPFGALLPVEVAARRLQRLARPIQRTESVGVLDAVGRIAAVSFAAPWPIPRTARATWDGYAVASADVRHATAGRPVPLRIVGELFAEESWSKPWRPGTTVAVATGAALPDGADTVVIFEETARTEEGILVSRPSGPGEKIAQTGEDLAKGAPIVTAGDVLTPPRLGALAMFGKARVSVYGRPRVALVPNGNELLAPGSPRRAGQIYESNNISLAAVIRAFGGEPVAYPPVPDDRDEIETVLRRAAGACDVVISTGGSSVGERDYLPEVFRRIGRVAFHGIAVRPGKPTLAATSGRVLFLGMPGHPTSCLANMYWLVGPVLRRIARLPGPGWSRARVRLLEGYPISPSALTTVVPLRVEDGQATPTFRDSSAITSLSGANAFVLVPPNGGPLRAGSEVDVAILPPPIADAPASTRPLRDARRPPEPI